MIPLLENLQVLEIANVLAGPSAGTFFKELGAKVIKIENPRTKGDITRRWRSATESDETTLSSYYCSANGYKDVRFLDLTLPENRAPLEALIKDADILIANCTPRQMHSLKIEPEFLRSIHPKLIYANLAGYFSDPERPAFDVLIQAESGFMSMTGAPDTLPVKIPVALMDVLAAHHLKEAILLALLKLSAEGKGSFIEVSLFQSAVASLANQASDYLMNSNIPQRIGTQHPQIAPYGDLYESKDGKLLILAIGTDKQFISLCHVIGYPEIEKDPRFATNPSRVRNRQELNKKLKSIFITKTAGHWLNLFKQKHIPSGHVLNLNEVFTLPEAREMVVEETVEPHFICKRVSQIAFKLKDL